MTLEPFARAPEGALRRIAVTGGPGAGKTTLWRALSQQYRAELMPVSILYAYRRNLPLRVRRFMDWVTQVLRPHLEA